jgi:hypothetical protein
MMTNLRQFFVCLHFTVQSHRVIPYFVCLFVCESASQHHRMCASNRWTQCQCLLDNAIEDSVWIIQLQIPFQMRLLQDFFFQHLFIACQYKTLRKKAVVAFSETQTTG